MENSQRAEDLEIAPEALRERRREGSPLTLVDIRRPREREVVSLEDDDWIPMDKLGENLEEFREAPKPIVIYCHHGVRSLRVAGLLADEGFEEVYSLAGGIDAWARRIDDSMNRY